MLAAALVTAAQWLPHPLQSQPPPRSSPLPTCSSSCSRWQLLQPRWTPTLQQSLACAFLCPQEQPASPRPGLPRTECLERVPSRTLVTQPCCSPVPLQQPPSSSRCSRTLLMSSSRCSRTLRSRSRRRLQPRLTSGVQGIRFVSSKALMLRHANAASQPVAQLHTAGRGGDCWRARKRRLHGLESQGSQR